jgi:hypothetical protein
LRRSASRPRRHGRILEPADRRTLERAGWRTTLDYRENHVRGLDGRLLCVEPVWTAEAERFDGEVSVAAASAPTTDEAGAVLVDEIAQGRVSRLHRVRIASG